MESLIWKGFFVFWVFFFPAGQFCHVCKKTRNQPKQQKKALYCLPGPAVVHVHVHYFPTHCMSFREPLSKVIKKGISRRNSTSLCEKLQVIGYLVYSSVSLSEGMFVKQRSRAPHKHQLQ